jgi:hypothetical protein
VLKVSSQSKKENKMLRHLMLVAAVAAGAWFSSVGTASADHSCYRSGYYSGYRPPVVPYNSYYNQYGPPHYRVYNNPIPGTFHYGYNTSYYGPGYGTGHHAPFGGYGVSGFPRYVGSPYSPGFSVYLGR